ncbi:MAG TPA: M48 family metalloprotease [Vicinamibacterales bacterium]|nr:M48 family metalloprotease [Vicinamibacterales bacterium]
MERITFAHAIVPTRVSIPYRIGLVVVALAMLLLPAVYLALIVGTIWFSYWYLTTVSPSAMSTGLGFRGLTVAGPPFAGGVLAFFLIKPVLARRATARSSIPLEPHEEPEFFAFIEQICLQVGAPVPRRVQVDCQVNASASFVAEPLSLVRRDLVLTVGLPLVVGLSARELGGVLAHEFGHFAQGGALRLTWIVRSINSWFYRVVYERDRWDVALEERSKGANRFGLFILLAGLFVWLSRRALAGLMMAGHAVSCFLMRQMEYDADSYEIKVAGTESFTRTMARLRELNAGVQYGYHELRQARVLPANLPHYFVEQCRHMPAGVREKERPPDAARGAFDTHPSDADRIRVAERAANEGAMVGGDEPATELFRDFESTAVAATRHHYEHNLGLTLDAKTLVGTADAIKESSARQERSSGVKRYFGECVSVYRPLRVPFTDVESLSLDDVHGKLAAAREAMPTSEALRDAYRQYERLTVRADKAFVAEELCVAGASVSCEEYELDKGTLDGAEATQRWAANELTTLTPALERFEQAASLRLACALSLALRGPEAADVRPLIDAFHAVGRAVPQVFATTRFLNAYFVLSAASNSIDPPPAVSSRVATMNAKIGRACGEIVQTLGTVPYPTPPSDEPSTVAAWCGIAPDVATFDPTEVLPRIMSSYWTLLGHLVSIAQNAEDRMRTGSVLG